jgi:hypothetical protein
MKVINNRRAISKKLSVMWKRRRNINVNRKRRKAGSGGYLANGENINVSAYRKLS